MHPAEHVDASVGYFTVGSTRDEVLAVQGTPTEFAERVWKYGSSSVFFNNGRVASWDIWPGAPLRARMLPAEHVDASVGYFTVGSTKDEVLAVQGAPTEFTERVWKYGSSSVFFNNGRVVSWDIWPGAPLRIQMPKPEP
jgi:outer membrane protein assembly factor BamE (lipoprotein component of BamABCDE complex)